MRTAGMICYSSFMTTNTEPLGFTPDVIVKRLRWVMVCVILFNFFTGAISQPEAYWHNPGITDEANHLFRYFMAQGPLVWFAFDAVYILAAFAIVSFACRRTALIALFGYILGHFAGTSNWLVNYFHGAAIAIVYAVVLGAVIVRLAFPAADAADFQAGLTAAKP